MRKGARLLLPNFLTVKFFILIKIGDQFNFLLLPSWGQINWQIAILQSTQNCSFEKTLSTPVWLV
jgi:hypothetical protein